MSEKKYQAGNAFSVKSWVSTEVESKQTNSGKSYVKFAMAIKKTVSGEDKTLWVNCTCWGTVGMQVLEMNLKKGDMVTVTGSFTPADDGTLELSNDGKARFSLNVSEVQKHTQYWIKEEDVRINTPNNNTSIDAGLPELEVDTGITEDEIPF